MAQRAVEPSTIKKEELVRLFLFYDPARFRAFLVVDAANRGNPQTAETGWAAEAYGQLWLQFGEFSRASP